jgi:hypothetical protein
MTHRLLGPTVPVAVLALLLAGCASTAADDLGLDAADVDALEQAGVDVEQIAEQFTSIDAHPELDLETFEVVTPAGAVPAEPFPNTYVGRVTDDIYIGVSLGDPTGAGEVSVYLCDSDEIYTLMSGELTNGEATLSDGDTSVTLIMTDAALTGTATIEGGDPLEFTAESATGVAGMYEVTQEVGDVDHWMRWIVLNDETQRGVSICCSWTPIGPICFPCEQN